MIRHMHANEQRTLNDDDYQYVTQCPPAFALGATHHQVRRETRLAVRRQRRDYFAMQRMIEAEQELLSAIA